MGKCVYCKGEVNNKALDVCDQCGAKIWGPKMFKAIVSNMEGAKDRGDLEQGNVY